MAPEVLAEYVPIVLLLAVALAFGIGSVAVATRLGPNRPNPTKLAAYECGNEPLANVVEQRFPVKFYVVAMMFLIFDVETVFLYPWAVTFADMGWFGIAQMGLFLTILSIAFVYEIARGGLDWD